MCCGSSQQGHCSTPGTAAATAAVAAPKAADEQDPAADGGLYSLLDARTQSIVAPFLTTRFTQTAAKAGDVGAWPLMHQHCTVCFAHKSQVRIPCMTLLAAASVWCWW